LADKYDSQILLSPEKQFIHGDSFHRGFVQVPRMIVACIGLSAQAKVVYNYLSNYVYEHGRSAFPSVHRIAIACNMTTKSVVKYIRELVDKGFILKVRRGQGKSNDYYLKDAHEIHALRVSEMLWTALDSVIRRVPKCKWDKLHEAFNYLIKTVEQKMPLHNLNCSDESMKGIEDDLVAIIEGGAPTLAFIPRVKSKTPTAQPSVAPTNKKGKKEHYLKRDESTWGTDDFRDYFYRKYFDLTGSAHPVTDTVHRSIIVRALRQLDESKHELRKYIDAFFDIGYDNKSLEWFGTSGRLSEISLFIREGKRPFYIEKKSSYKPKRESSEPQQEYRGMDPNEFIKRLRGES